MEGFNHQRKWGYSIGIQRNDECGFIGSKHVFLQRDVVGFPWVSHAMRIHT